MLNLAITESRFFRNVTEGKMIVVDGFKSYYLSLEGTQMSSNESSRKRLTLEVGIDGGLSVTIERTGETGEDIDVRRLQASIPKEYELYFYTDSSKMIHGLVGRYYHFRNPSTGDLISFNAGPGRKAHRIVLGSLRIQGSKIRTVLENIPDRPFKKAHLVHQLPQNIVENRQPIKAALDILEREGYVRRLAGKGKSEEYVRTDKAIPPSFSASTLEQ